MRWIWTAGALIGGGYLCYLLVVLVLSAAGVSLTEAHLTWAGGAAIAGGVTAARVTWRFTASR